MKTIITSRITSLSTPLRHRLAPAPLTFLATLALAFTVPARAETNPAAIPLSEIGARATADYHGDAPGVTATADGARLRCGFQKLQAHATPEGLWLESTGPGGGKVRLLATNLSRETGFDLNLQPSSSLHPIGTVSVESNLVHFIRPGLTEEYSVSVDGVRQDFVIAAPPAGAGELRVDLSLSGARAEATAYGARVTLEGSGRVLAYSRLRVVDATGRELKAHLEVLSEDRLTVSLADANATYPVRIDPTFSDADWSPLGSGIGGGGNTFVSALAVSGTNLYVGGSFTFAGGVPANNIAKWDGNAWAALASGMDSPVRALAVSGTNLFAGGWFTTAGGVPASYIAKWDGNAWSALGSGMDGVVFTLAVSETNLYAGGGFITAGGVPASFVAKWNGSRWLPLGGTMNNWVYAVAVGGTNLYAGGEFNTGGGGTANFIAKWSGSLWGWTGLGSGVDNYVYALAVSGTDFYAGGNFLIAGGLPAKYIAKWDGSNWSALGSGMNYVVLTLAVSGTDLYAGGQFSTAGGVSANCIAKWDGSAWSALGSGVNSTVMALASDGMGHLFVGGFFNVAGNHSCASIAQANVGSLPAILMQPKSQTAEAGCVVNLAVRGTGYPPPTYQWLFNGNAIAGCTTCLLCLSGVQATNVGAYSVVVSNIYGAVTSSPARLNVIAAVERRPVPAINLIGESGSFLNVEFAELGSPVNWLPLDTVGLTTSPQLYFDITSPLPPQRFYRAWQSRTPGVVPSLSLPYFVPAITVTGNLGDSLRLDYIKKFGPTDAWVTLDTVTLTNTSQLYFDVSAPGQPARLYRIVPVP